MSAEFNTAQTRCITDEAAFAIVGYEGRVEHGEFIGTHAGCFKSIEAARAWLGGDGEPDFRIDWKSLNSSA